MSDGSGTGADSLWGYPSTGESRWPSALAVLVALAIQAALPDTIIVGPRFIVPALEAFMLISVLIGLGY